MNKDVLLNYDTNHLYYRNLLHCQIINANGQEERIEILISLYILPENKNLKITVINVQNLTESYSHVLTNSEYSSMKETQGLKITFENFPNKLKSLITACLEETLYIKIYTQTKKIILSFYKSSEFRELEILYLNVEQSTKEEIICNLLKLNEYLQYSYEKEKDNSVSQYNQLQTISLALQESQNNFEKLMEEKTLLKTKCVNIEEEKKRLLIKSDDDNHKILSLIKEIELLEQTKRKLLSYSQELQQDNVSMAENLRYYVTTTKELKAVIYKSVPMDQYNKLNEMFSSAVSDLLKSQLSMQTILNKNKSQQSENSRVKDELRKCIEKLNDLEEKVNSESMNPSCGISTSPSDLQIPPDDSDVHKDDAVADLIKQIEKKLDKL